MWTGFIRFQREKEKCILLGSNFLSNKKLIEILKSGSPILMLLQEILNVVNKISKID